MRSWRSLLVGLVEEGLDPGRVAGAAKVDHGDRRLAVQGNCDGTSSPVPRRAAA
jgi:hypothetical protein